MKSEISRRSFLLGGAGAATVASLGVPSMATPASAQVRHPAPGRQAVTPAPGQAAQRIPERASSSVPISMAMHTHASFSEGTGSMAAHLAEATSLGVDVIWWTDHDFRLAAYDYRQAVGFDGMSEDEGDLWWRWAETTAGDVQQAAGTFITQPRSPDEPGKALRLSVVGAGQRGGTLWYAARAFNSTYTTSLADTAIELDVLGELVGPDSHLRVRVECSYHPKTNGRPAGQYTLEYRIGGFHQSRRLADGLNGIIEMPLAPGWQRLTLRPVIDLAAIFAGLVADDNGLTDLRIGAFSRNGQRTSVVVDRMRFLRDRRAGDQGLDLRREIMASYADRYPDVRQHAAMELSLARHTNWFGDNLTLPDFGDRPPVSDRSLDYTRQTIAFVHAHGGLASYNHPLEKELATPSALSAFLIEHRGFGYDLVEIGAKATIGDMLAVLDATARNAVLYTAVGVTDDHEARNWLRQASTYLTNVWAESTDIPDLLAALRAGRAWFVEPNLWRGELDLLAGGTGIMGGVAVTDKTTVDLTALAADLPAGGTLEIVTGRVDFAGTADPTPAIANRITIAARDVPDSGHPFRVAVTGQGGYVRTVVRAANGAIVGVGNPLWLLRHDPPGGVPAARRVAV